MEAWASMGYGEAAYLDQFSLSLPITISVSNPGPGPLAAEVEELWLSLGDGSPAEIRMGEVAARLGAGSTGSLAFSVPVDLRKAEAAGQDREASRRAWAVEVVLGLRTEGRAPRRLRLSERGSLALVREPIFRISSISIERDILVETAMTLLLEVENPNDFPLRLSGLAYRLYGEGRAWTSGASAAPLEIPAHGAAQRPIGFTMNFADMDRRLFDLVARLKVVRYRLAGEASIETGIPGLPAFAARFDREGSSEVRR
jgi:LEA14-like dessication related protein